MTCIVLKSNWVLVLVKWLCALIATCISFCTWTRHPLFNVQQKTINTNVLEFSSLISIKSKQLKPCSRSPQNIQTKYFNNLNCTQVMHKNIFLKYKLTVRGGEFFRSEFSRHMLSSALHMSALFFYSCLEIQMHATAHEVFLGLKILWGYTKLCLVGN